MKELKFLREAADFELLVFVDTFGMHSIEYYRVSTVFLLHATNLASKVVDLRILHKIVVYNVILFQQHVQ